MAASLAHSYPARLERVETLRDGGKMLVRPIRPDDASMELAFVEALSAQSRYMRFFSYARSLSPDMVARLTQVDYVRNLALVAIITGDGASRIVGVARYAAIADSAACEFAVTVADDWQKRGIATLLMQRLIDAARDAGFHRMTGSVMSVNTAMRPLMRALGFSSHADPEDAALGICSLDLDCNAIAMGAASLRA